jgi:hypothetical protein
VRDLLRTVGLKHEHGNAERTVCVEQPPELIDRGQGHPAACHYAERKALL